jgi:thiazole synthase
MRIYGQDLPARIMVGTALYDSPAVMAAAIKAAKPGAITVSLRREGAQGAAAGGRFWGQVQEICEATSAAVLPNTAGCHSAREAITTAQMAREVFGVDWIKLEVIADPDTLQPDPFGLVEAARVLCADGFKVFPYCTEDLAVGEKLLQAGCEVLMPWGAPIGSARGLNNVYGLRMMRARFPDTVLIVDAGLGVPSHAAQAMELGFDGVLLNTAIAKSGNPEAMARAFALAVDAGRMAFEAGPMPVRDMAAPSTPMAGLAFRWE